MREFVLTGQGIILVKEDGRVVYIDIYRVTGWLFAQDRDNTISVKGYEIHVSIDSEEHQVFTDEKSLRNINVVMSLLLHEEVINSSY